MGIDFKAEFISDDDLEDVKDIESAGPSNHARELSIWTKTLKLKLSTWKYIGRTTIVKTYRKYCTRFVQEFVKHFLNNGDLDNIFSFHHSELYLLKSIGQPVSSHISLSS